MLETLERVLRQMGKNKPELLKLPWSRKELLKYRFSYLVNFSQGEGAYLINIDNTNVGLPRSWMKTTLTAFCFFFLISETHDRATSREKASAVVSFTESTGCIWSTTTYAHIPFENEKPTRCPRGKHWKQRTMGSFVPFNCTSAIIQFVLSFWAAKLPGFGWNFSKRGRCL